MYSRNRDRWMAIAGETSSRGQSASGFRVPPTCRVCQQSDLSEFTQQCSLE